MNTTALICFTIISLALLVGIFITKTGGFGRFSTSVLLLTAALIATTFCRLLDLVDSSLFGNIVFAIVGFAGGLISNKIGA